MGDVKYGAKRSNKDKSICLHAKKIEFIHPTTKVKISDDLPGISPLDILETQIRIKEKKLKAMTGDQIASVIGILSVCPNAKDKSLK